VNQTLLVRSGLEINPGPRISCDSCLAIFILPDDWSIHFPLGVNSFICPRCSYKPLAEWAIPASLIFDKTIVTVKQWFKKEYYSGYLCSLCYGFLPKQFPLALGSETDKMNVNFKRNVKCAKCLRLLFTDSLLRAIDFEIHFKNRDNILLLKKNLTMYGALESKKNSMSEAYYHSMLFMGFPFSYNTQKRIDRVVSEFYNQIVSFREERDSYVIQMGPYLAFVYKHKIMISRQLALKSYLPFQIDESISLKFQLLAFDERHGIDNGDHLQHSVFLDSRAISNQLCSYGTFLRSNSK